MVEYNSKENVKSGLPLGGIGAGKFEILPYGTFDYITYQNNWGTPLYNIINESNGRASGILGFSFGIFSQVGGKKSAKLLQTIKIKDIDCIDKITFKGSFPFASLDYHDKDLPLAVKLDAFSPFIPNDIYNSSIPGSIFSFKVKNRSKKPSACSILFVGRNLVGKNSIGRYNVVEKNNNCTNLLFRLRKPLAVDYSSGETCMSAGDAQSEVSFLNGWNLQTKNFQLTCDDINLEQAWKYFKKDGTLPNIDNKMEVQGGGVELGSAIACKFKLRPGQEKQLDFYYTWCFPKHNVGHLYAERFSSARSVAVYLRKNHKILEKKTKSWQEKIQKSGLPAWYKDAIINNLYILFSSSWLTKDKRFVMYEAPVICPLMGTLDVNFYGSVPITLLFPELEKDTLRQFKSAQRKNGYIPHDLGYSRIDMPSNGTTFYYWKDLNPKFVLMAYRDYLWTKDLKFLKQMYPAVKKAMEFSFSTDKNKDHLPDNEGTDQTFDCWYFHGTNSYTSSIFLAALKASSKIALILKDKDFQNKCDAWFVKGQKSFIDKLWNGKYFIASLNSIGKYDSCIVGQIIGQWYAHMLGLGYILPKEMVKKSIETVISLNSNDTKYGATNSVFKNGRRDKTSLHSGTIWPGVCYAFSSLAIYEGYQAQGLSIAKKVWDNFSENIKSPWNQPDLIDPDDGSFGFGDYYLRNAVVWSILLALGSKDEKIKKLVKELTSPFCRPLP